jgi:hypothetical protein
MTTTEYSGGATAHAEDRIRAAAVERAAAAERARRLDDQQAIRGIDDQVRTLIETDIESDEAKRVFAAYAEYSIARSEVTDAIRRVAASLIDYRAAVADYRAPVGGGSNVDH